MAVTGPGSAVLFAGRDSSLLPHLEAAFARDNIAAHHVNEPETLAASGAAGSNVTRAVLLVNPPSDQAHHLKAFRRLVFDKLRGLVAVMPEGSQILVVVDGRVGAAVYRPEHRIESIMVRLRAAAAREEASAVMLNAIFLTGTVDDPTVAQRICEATCHGSFPDSGFLVFDEDVRHQSISSAIAEQCS